MIVQDFSSELEGMVNQIGKQDEMYARILKDELLAIKHNDIVHLVTHGRLAFWIATAFQEVAQIIVRNPYVYPEDVTGIETGQSDRASRSVSLPTQWGEHRPLYELIMRHVETWVENNDMATY